MRILAFAIGLFIIFIACKLLSVPLKVMWKLLINAGFGALLLLLVNLIGGIFNFAISITFIAALIAGIFGVPGVIFLIIVNLLF